MNVNYNDINSLIYYSYHLEIIDQYLVNQGNVDNYLKLQRILSGSVAPPSSLPASGSVLGGKFQGFSGQKSGKPVLINFLERFFIIHAKKI